MRIAMCKHYKKWFCFPLAIVVLIIAVMATGCNNQAIPFTFHDYTLDIEIGLKSKQNALKKMYGDEWRGSNQPGVYKIGNAPEEEFLLYFWGQKRRSQPSEIFLVGADVTRFTFAGIPMGSGEDAYIEVLGQPDTRIEDAKFLMMERQGIPGPYTQLIFLINHSVRITVYLSDDSAFLWRWAAVEFIAQV